MFMTCEEEIPLNGSFFSEPKDLLDKVRKFLLPEDEKRYLSLGHKKAAEQSLLQAFQVLICFGLSSIFRSFFN